MIIFGFRLVCVSGRVDLGSLLTPHGIWRLLCTGPDRILKLLVLEIINNFFLGHFGQFLA
jgi:hypothetical protein